MRIGRLMALLLMVWSHAIPTTAQNYTVATIERKPFAFQNEDGWTGFSIELWQEIIAEIGGRTTFVETSSFPELLEQVELREANAAVANISITSQRETNMDFSQPIFDSGLMILAPITSDASIFGAIFNRELLVWLAGALVVLFLAANLIYLFERRTNPEFRHPYLKGLGEGMWWAINAILNAGFEIASPASRAGRLLAFLLILVGLFVVGAFVAQITASLTIDKLQAQVGGYEDLYDKAVGTTTGSTSANFMTAHSIRFEGYERIDDVFAALEAGEIDAMVHDAPILSYYAQTAGRGRFQTVGRLFNPEKYGIALPSGSPAREEINRALLKLREDGTYAGLVDKWFGADYQ